MIRNGGAEPTQKIAPSGAELGSAIWAWVAFLVSHIIFHEQLSYSLVLQQDSLSTFRILVQIGASSTSTEFEPLLSNQLEGNDDDLMYDFNYDNSGGGPEGPDDEANLITMHKWKEHQFWTHMDEQLDMVCELATKHILDKQG